jgi:hypothetical protein
MPSEITICILSQHDIIRVGHRKKLPFRTTLREDITMPTTPNPQCPQEKNKILHLSKHKESVTVQCVCPKCGTHHKMKLRWTGRGKPKKFCQPCKTFAMSIEEVDACGVPSDVHKGIEKAV